MSTRVSAGSGRPPHSGLPSSAIACSERSDHPLPENTANIDIFAVIAPFQRTGGVASDLIDENGRLPYKPRQLSKMARFDRGGSIWAGHAPLCAPASSES